MAPISFRVHWTGANVLSKRRIEIIQLVDWETYIIRIRLSYVRFRVDTRFPVSFFFLFSFFAFTITLIINLNSRIYVETRLHALLDFRFNQPFFQRGDGSYSTPFDQGLSFFLVHHSFLLYRILPYHERGRRLYQWMVPRRSRQKNSGLTMLKVCF